MTTNTDADDRKANPVKYYTKFICHILYFCGLSHVWYEEEPVRPFLRQFYPAWAILNHLFLTSIIANEGLALLREDLSVEEQQTALQNTLAHTSMYLTYILLMIQRKIIRNFFKEMYETDSSVYRCVELEEAAKKRAKWNSIILTATMYYALFSATVDGIRAHINTGIPVRTLVTYWPADSDRGFFIEISRLLIQFHWWYILSLMLLIESVYLIAVVFLAYRFKALRNYFDTLYEGYDDSQNIPEDQFESVVVKKFVTGIKLHADILRNVDSVNDAFKNIYSVQVLQSLFLPAMCLIKLEAGDISFTYLMANYAYIQSVVCLTATHMISAGDITYEAELLPFSIFHCGWERFGGDPKFRALVQIALQRSQIPIIFTAFGIFPLSYGALITILRASYSFFALVVC